MMVPEAASSGGYRRAALAACLHRQSLFDMRRTEGARTPAGQKRQAFAATSSPSLHCALDVFCAASRTAFEAAIQYRRLFRFCRHLLPDKNRFVCCPAESARCYGYDVAFNRQHVSGSLSSGATISPVWSVDAATFWVPNIRTPFR